jgi:hypothetical protein
MARPKNTVESQPLRLAVSPAMRTALAKVAATGLFGSNPNEIALRLISDGISSLAARAVETRETLNKLEIGKE